EIKSVYSFALSVLQSIPIIFCYILHYLIFFSQSIPTVNSQINEWPKPRKLSWPYPQANLLSPAFKIISPHHHKHLTPAIQRYRNLIHSEHYNPIIIQHPNVINITTTSSSHPPLEILTLTITDLNSPLQHGVDESYDLTIPTVGSANLTSKTVWGAMRGLETFSQLVWSGGGGGESLLFVGTGLYVSDWPIFGHRGVLLDTSRNYYGVEDIIRTIKAMSANKLNVFHWHITDSHSFPLVLPLEPELSRKGSYGPKMQYSVADVRKIVEIGFQHGVRVLPEIDMPGHTGSWAEAYPEIVTCANMFWQPAGTAWEDRLASEPGTGQLNSLNPKTYEVTHNILKDMATLFPEGFFHAGADEVVSGCWKTDPMVQNFVSNGGTFSQLLEIFINSTLPYITSLNHSNVFYWEDVLLDHNVKVDPSFLPKDSVILQTWNNGPNNTKLIVSAGYRAIVSSSDFYYLDCGHGGFVGNDSRYDKQNGDDSGSPFNYNNGNEDEAKLVLGGEVALWSEQADPSVLDARIWPRASAMAETLWILRKLAKSAPVAFINMLNETQSVGKLRVPIGAVAAVSDGLSNYLDFSPPNVALLDDIQEESGRLTPDKWIKFELQDTERVNHNSHLFRAPVGLGDNGKTEYVLRSYAYHYVFRYTPISDPESKGYFDLLVKIYPEGKMSRHLANLRPGDVLEVKGPKIAGGTGITPILQVIDAILKNPDDKTQIYYTVENPTNNWKGRKGYITQNMVEKGMPSPSEDTLILVSCSAPSFHPKFGADFQFVA
ncbi:hypothetical protein C5167_012541, partial [Papaver somniferum]